MGLNPEPLWLPSQKGCVADMPQAHQAYFLFSHFITKGDFWATFGSAIIYPFN